ncbi:MAG: hypothetical protein Q4G64_07565 [bacterium]|nr:hypothetical protein [bacterium]
MPLVPRSLGDIAARFARPVRTTPVGRSGGSAGVASGGGPDTPLEQLRVARVEWGGALAVQADETSCGAACLVMLAATGDPVLAGWLDSGELPAGVGLGDLPPEIPALALGAELDAGGRFAAAQQVVRGLTRSRGLGPLPWPRSLGTAPWAAARVARFPGVRYVSRPVDDRGAAGQEMLSLVLNALRQGLPVLLYTGGDRGTGLATAMPRHVVLAVPGEGRVTTEGVPVVSIYEPHSGNVFEVPADSLVDRTERSRALGGWTHVQWVVLPQPLSS